MNTLIRKYKKFLQMIGYFLVDLGIPDSPFVRTKGTSETFKKLADKAMKEVYGEVEQFELESGFKIDRDWINELAFKTQIVIKDSKLCYAHGRILYAALSKYLSQQNSLIKQDLIIIETGTARGFSSLCMAKALSDLGSSGKILTFDLIPNERKMFWNCIEDLEGEKTRLELLSKWRELVDRFIIFIEGDTRQTLKTCSVSRVNFAFLDGAHTYEDVMFEFSQIKDKQIKGDVIVYDDYSPNLFPGIVSAVDDICKTHNYKKEVLVSEENRAYVVATKN